MYDYYIGQLRTNLDEAQTAWKKLGDLTVKTSRWADDLIIKVVFLVASIDTLLDDFTDFITYCEEVLPQGYPFSRAEEVVFDGAVTIGLKLKELEGYLIMSDEEAELMKRINGALFTIILAGQELTKEV